LQEQIAQMQAYQEAQEARQEALRQQQEALHQQQMLALSQHYQRQLTDLTGYFRSQMPGTDEPPASLFAPPEVPLSAPAPAPVPFPVSIFVCCFSWYAHHAGTNYINWLLCRHSRQVRTRLQVLALHWVLLHPTKLTRPTPRSRTCTLHRRRGTPRGRLSRRSRGTPGRQASQRRRTGGTTVRLRSRVGVCMSTVVALGPLGTTHRARYLCFSLLDLHR